MYQSVSVCRGRDVLFLLGPTCVLVGEREREGSREKGDGRQRDGDEDRDRETQRQIGSESVYVSLCVCIRVCKNRPNFTRTFDVLLPH